MFTVHLTVILAKIHYFVFIFLLISCNTHSTNNKYINWNFTTTFCWLRTSTQASKVLPSTDDVQLLILKLEVLMCKMLHRFLVFGTNIILAPLLFKVTCLIGLSWQLFDISSEYLKYKVNSRTAVFIPERVEDRSMGICIPMKYSIDYKKLNTELQYNSTQDQFFRKGMMLNLSIHEIYNYTYDAENILYDVDYWEDVWGGSPNTTNLSSIMDMQKYFFRSYICYLYSIRSFKPLSVHWITGSYVVYLAFGKQLAETDVFRLFVAAKARIPFRETIEARYIYLGNSVKLDYFHSSHFSITEQLLPPPFETGCFSYSKLNFTNSIECIESCMVLQSFKKWGKIPFRSLVPNNAVDYKFVKASNYTKYYAELDEIRLFCETSCPNRSCDDTQIVTIHEKEAHSDFYNTTKKNISIIWERKTPSIPSVEILSRPTSTLTDLILYMMSSVSTWTGLSMMSINPFLLLRSLVKTKLASRVSSLQLHQHHQILAMNHTDRMSRLEDCVVSQSLAIDKLRQMVFRPVNNRSRGVRQ